MKGEDKRRGARTNKKGRDYLNVGLFFVSAAIVLEMPPSKWYDETRASSSEALWDDACQTRQSSGQWQQRQ
jgi:hypothetical protein